MALCRSSWPESCLRCRVSEPVSHNLHLRIWRKTFCNLFSYEFSFSSKQLCKPHAATFAGDWCIGVSRWERWEAVKFKQRHCTGETAETAIHFFFPTFKSSFLKAQFESMLWPFKLPTACAPQQDNSSSTTLYLGNATLSLLRHLQNNFVWVIRKCKCNRTNCGSFLGLKICWQFCFF